MPTRHHEISMFKPNKNPLSTNSKSGKMMYQVQLWTF